MTIAWGKYGRRIGTLALGLGVAVMAAHSGKDGMMNAKAADGHVRCEIEVEELGMGVKLQGVVFANRAVNGAYQLQVSKSGSGGSSNINQGGHFNARPNVPAKLGVVQLGGDGGSYSARLRVMWDGEEIECEKSVGGGWL